MRDVAEAAGVSLKTVSRVVNQEHGVTAPLEERVRAAIDALGYQPDDRARFLRRSATSSRSLGFVQMDVANPFFSSIFRGLEDVARDNGFLVLSGSSDADPGREEALIRAFIARRVDGLVIASGRSSLEFLATEVAHGTPLVFLDIDPPIDAGDVIRTDHFQGAVTATQHLLQHGHTEVAFLGDDVGYFSARQRRDGFLDVMTKAGFFSPIVLPDLTNPEQAEEAALLLLQSDRRPTALFTAQNFVTIGAIRALHRLGLQHEIALVGFDDLELAELVSPKITVVPQHPLLLGLLAGERLFARLSGDTKPPEHNIINPTLIERGSGEIPPS